MSNTRPMHAPARRHAIKLLIFIVLVAASGANASSLRFYGNGDNDIDRVKIRIDDPANNNPGPPADVGSSDFTVEFWIRPTPENTGAVSCGFNYSWVNGNVVFDRDRFNQGRTFGVSLGGGRVAFAVQNGSFESRTLCGSTDLRDNTWHHVAVQRRRSDGFMWVYVDGVLEASGDGPDGDVSYPDNGVPGNFCNSGPCTNSDPFIVIGAEKHDAGSQYPSYFGWVDEVRLSDVLRYTANFSPAQQAFVADNDTAALYHFDEGSGDVIGDSAVGSQSPGQRNFGGNPAGPVWSSETPFSGGGGSAGSVRLSAAAYSVAENAGTATIFVQRIGGSTGAISVDYSTADGTASSGADYQTAMGTLNWSNGDASTKSFPVTISDDLDVEGDETVDITLSNAVGGATLAAPSAAVLTISDNDVANPGSVQLSSASYSVGEGPGVSVSIQITRNGGSDGAASVDYSTSDGRATAGADYQAVSGTANWSDGDAGAKAFSINILDDAELEGDETINISLQNANGAAVGNPQNAVLTIVDDEVAAAGTVQFSSASYSVGESAGTLAVSVTRLGGTNGAVSVNYASQNGTASSGSDYQSVNGILSWTDGDGSQKTIDVTINDDAVDESDETLTLSLDSPTGGLQLGVPDAATVRILDDDAPAPPPRRDGGGGGSAGIILLLVLIGTIAYGRGRSLRRPSREHVVRKRASSSDVGWRLPAFPNSAL